MKGDIFDQVYGLFKYLENIKPVETEEIISRLDTLYMVHVEMEPEGRNKLVGFFISSLVSEILKRHNKEFLHDEFRSQWFDDLGDLAETFTFLAEEER